MNQPRRLYPPRFAVLLLCTLAACLASPSFARVPVTYNVPLGGSIQTAIDGALAGDIVQLAAGIYHERIDFKGKNLTVRGAYDAAGHSLSTLDGDDAGTVVKIMTGETRGAVLEYVQVTDGNSTTVGRGGIYCSGSSPTVRHCSIGDCRATQKGGGVAVSGGAPRFEDCTISGCSATVNGAAVAVNGATGAEFIRCTLNSNQSYGQGGGFYLYNAGVLISECEVSNCGAATNGGGICLVGTGGAVIEKTALFSCEALGVGGCVYADASSQWEMRNCRLSSSREADYGGGVYVRGAGLAKLVRNRIFGNPVVMYGGGVYLASASHALLDGNTIVGNSASTGTGVWVETADAIFVNNIIAYNVGGEGVAGPNSDFAANFSYCCIFGNTTNNMQTGFDSMLGKRGNFAADPLFADRATGDFHLRSQAGRYVEASHTWVKDAGTSACIDAGSPSSPYGSEPVPHGGRLNMGAYGNTTQASKSPAAPVLAWTGEGGYTADGVHPDQEAPGASFNFRIKYTNADGLPPGLMRLRLYKPDGTRVAGSPFTLARMGGGGTWITGLIYAQSVALPVHGRYAYQFEVVATGHTLLFPATRQPGPVVDRPPTLAWTGAAGYVADGVQPQNAAPGTTFVFKVRYSDPDNEPPTWVRLDLRGPDGLALPGSPFPVPRDGTSTDWAGGVIYRKALALNTPGLYEHRFVCQNAFDSAELVEDGVAGPTVTAAPAPPTLGAVTPQAADQGASLTYTLSAPAEVSASVFNLAGRLVAEVPAASQEYGVRTLRWSGRNSAGALAPAGVYLIRLTACAEEGASAQAVVVVNLRR